MTYYSVLEVTPTADDWVADYIGPANALVNKYGGKYLARTSSHERMEGENRTFWGSDPKSAGLLSCDIS